MCLVADAISPDLHEMETRHLPEAAGPKGTESCEGETRLKIFQKIKPNV